jgi:hypothetical protein
MLTNTPRGKGSRNLSRRAWLSLLAGVVGCGNAQITKGGSGPIGNDTGGTRSARDAGPGSGALQDSGAGGAPVFHVEGGTTPPVTGADGSAGHPGNTCAAATTEVTPTPLDIALLVDTSYSMDFDLRWQYVKGALTSFVASPGQDDLGLALQFFPLREQCDVNAYAAPAFPMANVVSAHTDIEDTLNSRRMSGGTPIVQALQGMGTYAMKWAGDHPDHKTVIVVATDGVPDSTCSASSLNPPNDLPNAAKTAKALAAGSPALPVFVIGVGAELEALNTIADAGGTGAAVLIADGASAQKQFLDALRNIRQKSLGCDYVVPDAQSGAIDYDTVNVDFTEGSRTADAFYYVADAGRCGLKPDAGWYYDDAKTPTKVILCPKTCDRVAKAPTARIDIAYGCKRREVR